MANRRRSVGPAVGLCGLWGRFGEPHIRLEALASWSETYSNMSGGYMEGLFAIEVLEWTCRSWTMRPAP